MTKFIMRLISSAALILFKMSILMYSIRQGKLLTEDVYEYYDDNVDIYFDIYSRCIFLTVDSHRVNNYFSFVLLSPLEANKFMLV